MMGFEPRWFGRPPTKPGYGEPEPVKPISTMDAPENVAVCLDCPLPKCRSEYPVCPLYGKKPSVTGRSRKTKREKALERDGKIRDLINAGWVNNDAICEELGIGKSTLSAAKKRLRERGEIN